jgi:AcrR family transcriptional regulator
MVGMQHRARSAEAKQRRTEELLVAAAELAAELGGVRHLTLVAVFDRAGLDSSAMRRYFASKEELLLELAERGWQQWSDLVVTESIGVTDRTPAEIALVVAETLVRLPLFCDLLTHITLNLEGEVSLDRAYRYKSHAFAAHDALVAALVDSGQMNLDQVNDLIAATLGIAAMHWQLSHPTETLAELYRQYPDWGHVALDFLPRLTRLLQATAIGLTQP